MFANTMLPCIVVIQDMAAMLSVLTVSTDGLLSQLIVQYGVFIMYQAPS